MPSIALTARGSGAEAARLVRLRYEPGRDKYILAYSDEADPRFAGREEVGDFAASAIRFEQAPAGALAAPLVAQISVTRDCNLACKFCYAELQTHRGERTMTTAEVKDVIDMLWQNGVIYLEWAGGEPLLRDDFVELLRYAYERDFKQSIITNGTHFTDEFLELAARCLKNLQISIDDVGEHYDAVKGGPFWRILRNNIRRALDAGVPAVASVVLTEANVSRLEEIAELIWRSGFSNARLCWQVAVGEAKTQSLLSYRELVMGSVPRIRALQRQYLKKGLTIHSVQEQRAGHGKGFLPREFLLCSAGRTRLQIEWNGDAYACPLLKYEEFHAGNILRDGLQAVWSSPAFDEIRAVKNGALCEDCKLYCGYWCRALVYGFTREISMTPSPICHHTWKADGELGSPLTA